MARSVDYNEKLLESLKDSEEAAAYLNAVLAEDDPSLFLKALKKVADANGGVAKIAKKTNVSRVGLYKAFSDKGNPGFKTVEDILSTFNLSLFVKPAGAGHTSKRPRQAKPRRLVAVTG
jgi:probable addiction module antidote protein